MHRPDSTGRSTAPRDGDGDGERARTLRLHNLHAQRACLRWSARSRIGEGNMGGRQRLVPEMR